MPDAHCRSAQQHRERLSRRLHEEHGSFLVEVMVSAVIVLVVGLGVLRMVDRTTELSGQQRTQAVAGNVAQVELDTVKAFPISQLSNLRRTTSRTVGGVLYQITTRADWVNDTTMAPNCTTPGATADYLKVRTTVTHPGIRSRRPAELETIVSPRVRSFLATQGSLAVLVTDSTGAPVPGLTIGLTGPSSNLSEPTNANGCVLWGYLPASNDYRVAFSRPGWVEPDGTSAANDPVKITGDETTNANYQLDRGAAIRASFKTQRPDEPLMATHPRFVSVDNSTGDSVSKNYDIGTADNLDTTSSGLLFPFANPYAVYADTCSSARPPTPTSVALAPGANARADDVLIPALNITVKYHGINVPFATVRVTTPCGNTYARRTDIHGLIDDPGFPYATDGMTICASSFSHKIELEDQANTNFGGEDVTLDIGTSGPGSTGTCT